MTAGKFNRLLMQIHKGNMRALTPIFVEYYEKMIISAKCILHNPADAEDAAANVIIKIIKFAEKNPNPKIENAGAYINSAIKNESINIFNSKKNIVCLDYLEETAATVNNDINALINNIALEQALKKLPEQEREIAQMFYFYDYSINKIAAELDLPVGTVKWKLSAIRKSLYELIK